MRGDTAVSELREIIGNNIADLRTKAHLTQTRLAELLNYSDKAVSKWERGEAVPDVAVLKQIADYFGVTLDYLVRAEHTADEIPTSLPPVRSNKLVISLISMAGAWLVATLVFALLLSLNIQAFAPWLVYIYAIPITFILAIVFNSVWGVRRLNFILWSLILWSGVWSVYLTSAVVFGINLWILFITAIPAEIILLFLPGIRTRGKCGIGKGGDRDEASDEAAN